MELDPRQGDLFLHALQGGKPEPYMNFRSKIDAMDPKRSPEVHQESQIPEGPETVVGSGK